LPVGEIRLGTIVPDERDGCGGCDVSDGLEGCPCQRHNAWEAVWPSEFSSVPSNSRPHVAIRLRPAPAGDRAG